MLSPVSLCQVASPLYVWTELKLMEKNSKNCFSPRNLKLRLLRQEILLGLWLGGSQLSVTQGCQSRSAQTGPGSPNTSNTGDGMRRQTRTAAIQLGRSRDQGQGYCHRGTKPGKKKKDSRTGQREQSEITSLLWENCYSPRVSAVPPWPDFNCQWVLVVLSRTVGQLQKGALA